MDTKAKGIILKLTDDKDADRLASVFAFDEGIITCKFTGVRKEKAKLKSAAQPFTFIDFIFSEKSDKKTITSCDIVDSFVGLYSNYDKTICGYIILDTISSILPKGKEENEILLLLINALKDIETKDEYVATIRFIVNFIDFMGLGLDLIDKKYVYLDTLTGNFTGEHTNQTVQIDNKVYSLIKSSTDKKEVECVVNTKKQALRLLHNILLLKFNEDVKSFKYL